MHDVPRQLSVEELAELFEGRTRFVELLAEREDPLDAAPTTSIAELSEAEKLEALTRIRRSARQRPLGALGRRAGRRRRPGGADRARVPEPGLRGEVRLPLRGLRQPPPEGGDPRGAARPARASREEELETALASWSRSRATAGRSLVDPYANEWLAVPRALAARVAGIVWIGDVVLLRRARQPSAPPTENERARRRRRGLGDPRRRLLPREKFMPRAAAAARALHWFKWEAYTTWLSGFALLVFLYYFNATRTCPAGRAARHGLVDRDQHRAARRRLGRLRRCSAACCGTSSCWRAGARPDDAGGVGRDQLFAPRGRLSSRSARCSGRSWSATSSS